MNSRKSSAREENRDNTGTLSDNLGNSWKFLELYSGKINISKNTHLFEAPWRGSGAPRLLYLSKSQKSLVKFGRTLMWCMNTNSTCDIQGQWKLLRLKQALPFWRFWLFVRGTSPIDDGPVWDSERLDDAGSARSSRCWGCIFQRWKKVFTTSRGCGVQVITCRRRRPCWKLQWFQNILH